MVPMPGDKVEDGDLAFIAPAGDGVQVDVALGHRGSLQVSLSQ